MATVVWCRPRQDAGGYEAGLGAVGFALNTPQEVLRLLEPHHPAVRVENRQKRRSQRLQCSLEVLVGLRTAAR